MAGSCLGDVMAASAQTGDSVLLGGESGVRHFEAVALGTVTPAAAATDAVALDADAFHEALKPTPMRLPRRLGRRLFQRFGFLSPSTAIT